MSWRRWAGWLLVLYMTLGTGWAEEREEDVDRVLLAARLIGDGYWDRAGRVLSEVDEDDETLARARFFTLRGLVRSHEGLHEQAIADYRLALAAEGADPLVNLQLAQALLTVGDPEAAVVAIGDAGEAGKARRGTWILLSRAHLALDQDREAWVALVQGQARFPEDLEFPRQQVFLLVQMGLFQEALVRGHALLERQADDPMAWLALAEALRQAGEPSEAIVLLEEARLWFGADTDIAGLLAKLYLDTAQPGAAGDILAVAAEVDASLFSPAAEAYRQAGELERALYMNSRVVDPADKARQRLGLYLEQRDWARAVALEERLVRLDLLAQDALRYALAYAWFQLGDVDRAERFLSGIADPRVFRDATALREAMRACSDAGWGCP